MTLVASSPRRRKAPRPDESVVARGAGMPGLGQRTFRPSCPRADTLAFNPAKQRVISPNGHKGYVFHRHQTSARAVSETVEVVFYTANVEQK